MRKIKSEPVQRSKREFLYSPALRNWQDAVKAGKPDDIDKYAEQHARLFGYINYGGYNGP